VVTVLRMSCSCLYTLSTPSVEGAGRVSRSVAVAATFWPALAKVGHYPPLVIDPHGLLRLEGGLALVQFSQMGLNYRSVADEFASSLCSPALDVDS
jgi:hypothetical protein